MTDNEIMELEQFTTASTYCKEVHISVYFVARCNFNDEFLVEYTDIPIEDLKDKPLSWFDPYMGRSKTSKIKLALAYADENRLYFIEDDGNGNRKVVYKDKLMTKYYTEDYDKTHILAAHIR